MVINLCIKSYFVTGIHLNFHSMLSVEIIATDEVIFWDQVPFLFLFFPSRHTSKCLHVKCNPTTKVGPNQCNQVFIIDNLLCRAVSQM